MIRTESEDMTYDLYQNGLEPRSLFLVSRALELATPLLHDCQKNQEANLRVCSRSSQQLFHKWLEISKTVFVCYYPDIMLILPR